jgi:two-component sensor histidine kinase
MICVPLVMQELPLGVMSCYTSDVRDFAIEEIEALETIAQQASFAIERARIQVRSTLLQEMNHRVKNNLQQITSLLRLQMRHGSDPQLVVSLQETLSRISAIAAVHDLLSRDDLDHVGLRTLAETLVHLQKESIVLPHHEIDYQIRGDDVFLGTAQATQIALILNELLQNAVEHGFESSRKGSIHITIENRGGDLGLWVSNLGNELPPDFDFHASTSLGLTIVTSLVKNLGGSFVLEDRLGWTVAEVRCHLIGAE